ncbi:uncharacterized protein [Montipora capricornis]|uniref:uncharacterized protein isoform X4 n=1 Tax=Montipora capricornis TaxID=246305 RepID=UPI0035F1C85D
MGKWLLQTHLSLIRDIKVYSKTSLPSGGTGYDAAISPEAGMRGKERRENEFAMQKMTQRSPTLFLPQAFLQCCTKLQNTVDS